MRVFMLGWEFPPYISGGLGTACYGLTKALDAAGVEICFVLPTPVPVSRGSHVSFRSPMDISGSRADGQEELHPPLSTEELIGILKHTELHRVEAIIQAYSDPVSFEQAIERLSIEKGLKPPQDTSATEGRTDSAMPSGTFRPKGKALYEGNLMGQVHRYEALVVQVARNERFDIVHPHDWMTFPAGLAVAAASGKPLVVHVHSTEFDRSGQKINQQIYDIERAGMHGAARVVCVSHLTAQIVTSRYGVPAEKVRIVYNAVELPDEVAGQMRPITHKEKIVLFLGRVTMQKGPEYFLRAAKKVVERYDNVRFVIAGSGDMINQCVREVADLRLGRHVTFTGFLRGDAIDRIFRMADLFVMPSVSEPFGIAPLEALSRNVPVIISKQSGVSEVLTHVLKVDFWDVDEMANKILAVLRHPPLQRALRQQAQIEVRRLSWGDSAEKLRDIYAEVMAEQQSAACGDDGPKSTP